MSEKLTLSEIDEKLRQEERDKSPGWMIRAVELRKMRLHVNTPGNETVRAVERERQEERPAESELRKWFAENADERLKDYVHILIGNGFDTLAVMADITMDDLLFLKVNRGHSKELLKLALKAKEMVGEGEAKVGSDGALETDIERRWRMVCQSFNRHAEVKGVKEKSEEEFKEMRKTAYEDFRQSLVKIAPDELKPYAPQLLDAELIKSEISTRFLEALELEAELLLAEAFRRWFVENAPAKLNNPKLDKLIEDWIATAPKLEKFIEDWITAAMLD